MGRPRNPERDKSMQRYLDADGKIIYNSRNYSILLNLTFNGEEWLSTTVEIILYYLTVRCMK